MIDETQKNNNDLLSKYFQAQGLGEKSKILVEQLTKQNNQVWSSLPWHNQFVPLIFKYFTKMPWVKYVNPSMTNYSGLIEIPKSEINKNLVNKFMPVSILVEKLPTEAEFFSLLKKNKLSLPVICKPNAGERSTDVWFLRTELDVYNFANSGFSKPFLLQEFLTQKCEFGIVIERESVKSQNFKIVSCVEKKARCIIGDGTASVRDLILNISVNELQKNKILQSVSATELTEILPKNEIRKIARTASVTLGTEFVDRQLEVTERLESALSKSLKKYKGFNVGRFDIMADSLAEIENENYKIIELNGVGATPLTIYVADKTVSEIYKILEDYYELLLRWGKKNAPRKKLNFRDFTDFLRQIYPAVKNQTTPESVKKMTKRNFRAMRKSFWQAEWKKFCGKIKNTFRT